MSYIYIQLYKFNDSIEVELKDFGFATLDSGPSTLDPACSPATSHPLLVTLFSLDFAIHDSAHPSHISQ